MEISSLLDKSRFAVFENVRLVNVSYETVNFLNNICGSSGG